MVASIENFGTVVSPAGQAAIAIISNPGIKTALAITCGYSKDPLGAFTEAQFWGRLAILRGRITPQDFVVAQNIDNLGFPVYDVPFHAVGPFNFLFPLADLQGSAAGGYDNPLTVILFVGQSAGVEAFKAWLNVAGQIKPITL